MLESPQPLSSQSFDVKLFFGSRLQTRRKNTLERRGNSADCEHVDWTSGFPEKGPYLEMVEASRHGSPGCGVRLMGIYIWQAIRNLPALAQRRAAMESEIWAIAK
jgi:hypothetical protein